MSFLNIEFPSKFLTLSNLLPKSRSYNTMLNHFIIDSAVLVCCTCIIIALRY